MRPEDHGEVEAASVLMLLNEDDEKLRLGCVEHEEREHQRIWAANPLPKGRKTDAKPGIGQKQHERMHFSQVWPRVREPFTVKYVDGYDPEDTEGEEERASPEHTLSRSRTLTAEHEHAVKSSSNGGPRVNGLLGVGRKPPKEARSKDTVAHSKPTNGDGDPPGNRADTEVGACHAKRSHVRDEFTSSVPTSVLRLPYHRTKQEEDQLIARSSGPPAQVLDSSRVDASRTSSRGKAVKLSPKQRELLAKLEDDNTDEVEAARSRVQRKRRK